MAQLLQDGFWEDKMAPAYILVLDGKQISYKVIVNLKIDKLLRFLLMDKIK